MILDKKKNKLMMSIVNTQANLEIHSNIFHHKKIQL